MNDRVPFYNSNRAASQGVAKTTDADVHRITSHCPLNKPWNCRDTVS